ncbi:MAG: methionyl-tRNA formyltransferase [Actinomycetota bacterium]|nr:methionyl-tRNA formyltransferase [Actinomycetota bacterium]
MRLVFAGTPAAAVPSLRALAESPHEIAAVLTRPDAPKGRGRTLARSPVGELADELGIDVLTPGHPRDEAFVATLRELAPDCVPVVAYGALVPPPVLAIPRIGWVNLHFSLLPAWRGAAPVQHAVLAGDEITGATAFLLEAGMDTGPVFGMLTETIGPHDTAGDVLDRLAESGAELLRATMDALAADRLTAVPQPTDGVSYAPKLEVADARVDWTAHAMRVDRLVRACTPAPGAWTTFREARVKLGPVRLAADVPPLPPGSLSVAKSRVLVGTATVPVELGEVQPVGKRPMAAADWARGVRIADDETFA